MREQVCSDTQVTIASLTVRSCDVSGRSCDSHLTVSGSLISLIIPYMASIGRTLLNKNITKSHDDTCNTCWRDAEERKKEATMVKQTTKLSNTTHPRRSLFLEKMSCLWVGLKPTELTAHRHRDSVWTSP